MKHKKDAAVMSAVLAFGAVVAVGMVMAQRRGAPAAPGSGGLFSLFGAPRTADGGGVVRAPGGYRPFPGFTVADRDDADAGADMRALWGGTTRTTVADRDDADAGRDMRDLADWFSRDQQSVWAVPDGR